jgi:hypothetical protein
MDVLIFLASQKLKRDISHIFSSFYNLLNTPMFSNALSERCERLM